MTKCFDISVTDNVMIIMLSQKLLLQEELLSVCLSPAGEESTPI